MSCPTCKRRVVWSSESPWRPFCSERCKLIDLGAWASESHAIAGETPEMSDDDQADLDLTSVTRDDPHS